MFPWEWYKTNDILSRTYVGVLAIFSLTQSVQNTTWISIFTFGILVGKIGSCFWVVVTIAMLLLAGKTIPRNFVGQQQAFQIASPRMELGVQQHADRTFSPLWEPTYQSTGTINTQWFAQQFCSVTTNTTKQMDKRCLAYPPLHFVVCRLESWHASVFCLPPSRSSSGFWPYPLSPGLAISALVCLYFAFHLLPSVISFSWPHFYPAFAYVTNKFIKVWHESNRLWHAKIYIPPWETEVWSDSIVSE